MEALRVKAQKVKLRKMMRGKTTKITRILCLKRSMGTGTGEKFTMSISTHKRAIYQGKIMR